MCSLSAMAQVSKSDTWAIADRLHIHAVAAECEWAITQLWADVCMRAALELSPGALQRVARSLCVWRDTALEQVQKSTTSLQTNTTTGMVDMLYIKSDACELPASARSPRRLPSL